MIVIGELINTSRKAINAAVEDRDEEFFVKLAKDQEAAGASYIDVNAGSRIHDELEVLPWLINLIQDEVKVPLCIDSPNHLAIEAALKIVKKRPLVNSITAEGDRIAKLLPIISEHDLRIIALCMDDRGMPETTEHRLEAADVIIDSLRGAGFADDDIFFDPLVKPIGVDRTAGMQVLDAIGALHGKYPDMHITSGLSNISYGLPSRADINMTFMPMCMLRGMDSAIVDPLNDAMMTHIVASEALMGLDNYCVKYLKFQRKKEKD